MQGKTTQLTEARPLADAARKRAAVETIARAGPELRKAARRYSLCEEDAEDAYQRGLEILLVKAPSDRPRELVPWAKTVIKHEALAIRRYRERMLGSEEDPAAWIPAAGGGPGELAELAEDVARSREALGSLKPAELRSLTLLAAGYSYAEIGEITGFSRTKVNRCLAEGRDRFRRHLAGSEDGSRCAEMASLLSAYCDGEASAAEATTVREHLRACAGCRATMRTYRAAPAAAAALMPALPVSRSLFERAQELLLGLQSRLAGSSGAADTGVQQVAAGGARGAGAAALAKLLAVCAGAVGGAGACVATGIAPMPPSLAPQHSAEAKIERVSERLIEAPVPAAVEYAPAEPPVPAPRPSPSRKPKVERPVAPEPAPPAAGAVEYAPPPEPAPTPPSPEPGTGSAGSPAGEFGP